MEFLKVVIITCMLVGQNFANFCNECVDNKLKFAITEDEFLLCDKPERFNKVVVKHIASTRKQCGRLQVLIEKIVKSREADEAGRLRRSHISTTILTEISTTSANIVETTTQISLKENTTSTVKAIFDRGGLDETTVQSVTTEMQVEEIDQNNAVIESTGKTACLQS